MDLYAEYPKSIQLIRTWIESRMDETSKGVPEEFVEEVKKRIDSIIDSMFMNNPRGLFDLFDEHNLYIIIRKYEKSDKSTEFRYTILPRDAGMKGKGHGVSDSRKETEALAIIDAIKMLEEKL